MYAKNWHISDFDYYALNLQCLSHDKILLAEGYFFLFSLFFILKEFILDEIHSEFLQQPTLPMVNKRIKKLIEIWSIYLLMLKIGCLQSKGKYFCKHNDSKFILMEYFYFHYFRFHAIFMKHSHSNLLKIKAASRKKLKCSQS